MSSQGQQAGLAANAFAIVLTIVAVVLASVVIAYVARSWKVTQVDPKGKGMGIFLIVISSITLLASLMYWIFLGVKNSTDVKAFATAAGQQFSSVF